MRGRGLLVIVMMAVIGSVSVSAQMFISQKSLIEGKGSSVPVIPAAAGCLMSYGYKNLYLYEHAGSMWDEIKVAVKASGGNVALQGHGSALTLEGCGSETPQDYATFLGPLKGELKTVVSYGCHTGKQFVEDLYNLLVKDNPSVVVYGPENQLVMDCGGEQKGNGRIIADPKFFKAAVGAWGGLAKPFFTALGTVATVDHWGAQQAANVAVKAADATAKATALCIALAKAYTPLWRSFITECDLVKNKWFFANGSGWLKAPAKFFFRELFPKSPWPKVFKAGDQSLQP